VFSLSPCESQGQPVSNKYPEQSTNYPQNSSSNSEFQLFTLFIAWLGGIVIALGLTELWLWFLRE
jgi:hypothetical protein